MKRVFLYSCAAIVIPWGRSAKSMNDSEGLGVAAGGFGLACFVIGGAAVRLWRRHRRWLGREHGWLTVPPWREALEPSPPELDVLRLAYVERRERRPQRRMLARSPAWRHCVVTVSARVCVASLAAEIADYALLGEALPLPRDGWVACLGERPRLCGSCDSFVSQDALWRLSSSDCCVSHADDGLCSYALPPSMGNHSWPFPFRRRTGRRLLSVDGRTARISHDEGLATVVFEVVSAEIGCNALRVLLVVRARRRAWVRQPCSFLRGGRVDRLRAGGQERAGRRRW